MTIGGKIKVFIADQEAIFRRGINYVLADKAHDIEVCGESSVDPSPVEVIIDCAPDVLILGITPPHLSGINICRDVKRQMASISVILTTPNPEDAELVKAIQARAADYLKRDVSGTELIQVIRRVAAGEYTINEALVGRPKVVEQILNEFQNIGMQKGMESVMCPLTQRENEVLRCLAQGLLNKQIATNLGISDQTVKNHVTSILRKLDANARTQAVVIAVKKGLISLSSE